MIQNLINESRTLGRNLKSTLFDINSSLILPRTRLEVLFMMANKFFRRQDGVKGNGQGVLELIQECSKQIRLMQLVRRGQVNRFFPWLGLLGLLAAIRIYQLLSDSYTPFMGRLPRFKWVYVIEQAPPTIACSVGGVSALRPLLLWVDQNAS